MSRTISVVNAAANETFEVLYNRVNDLIGAFGTEIVTANNLANGATTTGNAFVIGIFGSNTIVTSSLRGGNVQSSETLIISSNAHVNGSVLTVGNSTVNVFVNTTHVVIGNSTISGALTSWGNSTVNSTANSLGFKAGANVTVNSTGLTLGNSTVNTTINSSAIVRGSQVVNTTGFYSGANVIVNSTGLTIGNSTVNAVISATNAIWLNATSNVTISPNNIFFTVNSSINSSANLTLSAHTLLLVGNVSYGNISMTTDVISIGNSTVNTVVNSSFVTYTGNPVGAIDYTTSNTDAQVIDSFLIASYTSAEYLIEQSSNTSYQLSKMLVLHHPSVNTFITEYGMIASNGALGTFSANSNATHVKLNFVPSTAVTELKIMKTMLKA